MIELYLLQHNSNDCPHINYVKYPFKIENKLGGKNHIIYSKIECVDCGKEIKIEKLF